MAVPYLEGEELALARVAEMGREHLAAPGPVRDRGVEHPDHGLTRLEEEVQREGREGRDLGRQRGQFLRRNDIDQGGAARTVHHRAAAREILR